MRLTRKKRTKIRARLGVLSVEYMLVITFVVIPLGIAALGVLKMIGMYTSRIFGIVGLPFG